MVLYTVHNCNCSNVQLHVDYSIEFRSAFLLCIMVASSTHTRQNLVQCRLFFFEAEMDREMLVFSLIMTYILYLFIA